MRATFLLLAACFAAAVDDVDRTTYETKLGFIPGTKPDVDTQFVTVEQAKLICERKAECLAFTFKAAPDVKEKIHVYFKQDTTVAENDKSWASFVKRPAGLMDVSFKNDLPFPLELCWIDMVGTASPACYGTVACCGGTKNMSSFAGHNFVLKRLVWSLPAAAAAGAATTASTDAAKAKPLVIAARQRGHEWEGMGAVYGEANSSATSVPMSKALTALNTLSQPAEVCSAPRWASRLLQGQMPSGIESCHGVAASGGTLEVPSLPLDSILLARQLVGVVAIAKRVEEYSLQEQELSAPTMRRLVSAMKGAAGGGASKPPPAAGGRPPPAPPPKRPNAPPPPPPGGAKAAAEKVEEWRPLLSSPTGLSESEEASCKTLGGGPIQQWASGVASAIEETASTGPVPPLPASLLSLLGNEESADAEARGALTRLLKAARRLSPRLAAVAPPLVVTLAVPPQEQKVAIGSKGESSGSDVGLLSLDASTIAMHAVIALALGGVRALQVRVATTAAMDEGDEVSATLVSRALNEAWSLVSCAVGVSVDVVPATVDSTSASNILILGADGGSEPSAGWPMVEAYASESTLVLGMRSLEGGGGSAAAVHHPFVSSREHALEWHLSGDVYSEALSDVSCNECVATASALLKASCDLRPVYTLSIEASKVVQVVMEAASGWPVGYRLADKCDDLSELYGEVGVAAMCKAHACS